ncbi:MAG: putative zinc-binding protein [Candidatus Freyarchaeota archaeon]
MADEYVVILPCDGIGKVYGTVTREAARMIVKMRPGEAVLTCLPPLVVGDEDTANLVRENPCIAINGCRSACSEINVRGSGGRLVSSFCVTDVLRKNRDLKPESSRISEIGSKGRRLAEVLARAVTSEIDKILDSSNDEGGTDVDSP